MSEDAETKAKRRRRIKDSIPTPLNEIALRHVDSVQALSETQRTILANVLQKVGLRYLVDCLEILRNQDVKIDGESDLMTWLQHIDKPQVAPPESLFKIEESRSDDAAYLATLLTHCYADMPKSSADALVASEVMSASLDVVIAVSVGTAVFDDHVSLEVLPNKWTDTFVLPIRYDMALPPWDYAEVVNTVIPTLLKFRRGASL